MGLAVLLETSTDFDKQGLKWDPYHANDKHFWCNLGLWRWPAIGGAQRDLGCDKVLFPDGGYFGIFERTRTLYYNKDWICILVPQGLFINDVIIFVGWPRFPFHLCSMSFVSALKFVLGHWNWYQSFLFETVIIRLSITCTFSLRQVPV